MPQPIKGLFCLLLFWSAQSLHAQSELISYRCDDCDLISMLEDLSESHQLVFAYETSLLQGLKSSVAVTQQPASVVLAAILRPHNLAAVELYDRHYAIRREISPVERQAETRVLSGSVIQEENGEALPFATVRLNVGRGTRANEDGRFYIVITAPFPDSLTITYLGFQPQTVACAYGSDMEILLEPATTSIDDIIITDDNRQTLEVEDGGSVIAIDPRKLHLLSGLGEPDLLRGLQLMPGMTAANERATGLFIRGATPAENLILFDGITVYQPGHFFGLLSAFNPDAIKDVSLYRSGTGARYGGRTGGVIDITGKPGRLTRPGIAASINLMNAQFLARVPWENDKGGLLIAARRSYTDVAPSVFFRRLFDNRFQEGVIYFDKQQESQSLASTRLHYYDVNAKWLYRPNDRDLISVSAIKSGDELNYSLAEMPSASLEIDSEDKLRLVNEGVSANFARQWNTHHYTKINTSWSGFRNWYQFTYRIRQDEPVYRSDLSRVQRLQDLATRLEHTWSPGSRLRVTGGLHRNMLRLNDVVALDDDQSSLSEDRVETSQNLNAAFAEGAWTGERFGGELGIRIHMTDDSLRLYPEPRMMLFATIGEDFRMQINAGRYHQFLNYVSVDNQLQAGEDFWVLADEDSISAMRTDVASASFSYNTDAALVQIEGYVKQQQGLLAYTLTYNDNLNETDQGDLLRNGQGTVSGVELMVQKKNGLHTGWISYTYSRVLQRFPGNDESMYVAAAHDRPHQLSVVNQIQHGPWEASATWIWASGVPYTPATNVGEVALPNGESYYFLEFGQRNSERLPAYHRLDLTATYTFRYSTGSLRIGASCFNVYGRRNIGNRVFAVSRPANPGEEATVQVLDKSLLGFTPNLFLSWQL